MFTYVLSIRSFRCRPIISSRALLLLFTFLFWICHLVTCVINTLETHRYNVQLRKIGETQLHGIATIHFLIVSHFFILVVVCIRCAGFRNTSERLIFNYSHNVQYLPLSNIFSMLSQSDDFLIPLATVAAPFVAVCVGYKLKRSSKMKPQNPIENKVSFLLSFPFSVHFVIP